MASISYRLIESYNFKGSAPILYTTGAIAIVTIVLCFLTVNKFEFNPSSIKIAGYTTTHAKEIRKQFCTCFLTTDSKSSERISKDNCLHIEPNKKNVLLIGDSHAEDIATSLKNALRSNNINMLQASAIRCMPLIQTKGFSFCTDLFNYLYKDFLVKNAANIDEVIISANWLAAGIKKKEVLLKNIKNTIAYLNKYHLSVTILGQNETYLIPFPTVEAKEDEFGEQVRMVYMNKNSFYMNKFLKANLPLNYIDVFNYNTIPKAKADNIPYMFDQNHFTMYGADFTVNKIIDRIKLHIR